MTEFPTGTVPGRYWGELPDGRLECRLCPRYCRLRDGQRGLCFVRARSREEIVLTSYGRSSAFCVDPIPHFFFQGECLVIKCHYLQRNRVSNALRKVEEGNATERC